MYTKAQDPKGLQGAQDVADYAMSPCPWALRARDVAMLQEADRVS